MPLVREVLSTELLTCLQALDEPVDPVAKRLDLLAIAGAGSAQGLVESLLGAFAPSDLDPGRCWHIRLQVVAALMTIGAGRAPCVVGIEGQGARGCGRAAQTEAVMGKCGDPGRRGP
jgi:hypothetical protein